MSKRVRTVGEEFGGPSLDEESLHSRRPWVPEWLEAVGVPVWFVDPGGGLAFLNRRAEILLECSAERCLGTPCHLAVRGLDDLGQPLCGSCCRIREAACSGREIGLTTMQLPSAGVGRRWIQILVIPMRAPDGRGPWLAHLALDANRTRRFEEYFRSALHQPLATRSRRLALSPREREILRLLARNVDQKRIAARLFVSYTTVRNHVQHMLRKLDVNSIQEAVALHVLSEDRPGSREL